MRGILSDHNIEGHVEALVAILKSETWRDFWDYLNITALSFASLGISINISDRDLWHYCQTHELVLITANRNNDDLDSLEATMRQYNQATSLPVITIADSEEFGRDREYASEVSQRTVEYLLEIDLHRGTRRIYV